MPHILLVDDNQDLCYMLTCLFQIEGYTVTSAANGEIAFKHFYKQVPDLVLLDLMLPMVNGMEVCWRLRAFSNVPIIILSAKSNDIDKFQGFQAGANAYVTKPFKIDILLAHVKAFLKHHSAI